MPEFLQVCTQQSFLLVKEQNGTSIANDRGKRRGREMGNGKTDSCLVLEAGGISFWGTSAWSTDLKANTGLLPEPLRVPQAQHNQLPGRRQEAH